MSSLPPSVVGDAARSVSTPARPSSLYFQCAATPYSARRCICVRADLQLDRLAARADHRRVQRLVHVELRHRDEVLEPAGHRVPAGVQHAEHGVAVAQRVGEHADADQVVDVGELAAAHDHLLVDRVVVLGPAGDGGLDLRARAGRLDLVDHGGQELVACRRALGHQADDLVVHLGVQGGEREVLQLPLDRVHAEPVGQRCVDLERLAGDPLLLVLPEEPQRAHVVQPVGELDDQDPDVLAHRDDHLADGLGLRGVAVLDLVELGDAVDERGDLVAEVLDATAPACTACPRRCRAAARRTASAASCRARPGSSSTASGWVMYGSPLMPHLTAVVVLRDLVGLLDERQISLGVGVADDLEQRFEHRVGPALPPIRASRVRIRLGTAAALDRCRLLGSGREYLV